MTALIERIAPHATQLVRKDHADVLALFHRYRATVPPRMKRGLVRSACLALEVHAQVEEDILYPAVREVSTSEFLRKAVTEHDELRRLIGQLRDMDPADARYDATFMELMRDVMHHMADEETSFLPEAERVLRGRLGELGAHMVQRRMALLAPRAPALAYHRARALPARSLALLAGIVLGGVWIGNRWSAATGRRA
jgi:hemerythrin superfamily protein